MRRLSSIVLLICTGGLDCRRIAVQKTSLLLQLQYFIDMSATALCRAHQRTSRHRGGSHVADGKEKCPAGKGKIQFSLKK
jgi:hypothetical protein